MLKPLNTVLLSLIVIALTMISLRLSILTEVIKKDTSAVFVCGEEHPSKYEKSE